MNEQHANYGYRLNSLVAWHELDDGKGLQVRFPDGDHLTFDRDVAAIAKTLSQLEAGLRPNDDDIADGVLSLLNDRKMLVANTTIGRDWMADVLDYVLGLGETGAASSSPLSRARATRIDVRGSGWLADRVRDACAAAGFGATDATADGADDTLIVAASDVIAYDWFSGINAEAIETGVRVQFLWREVARLVAGPLVLPRQSACFDCYRKRVRMNVTFGTEFDAQARSVPGAGRIAGSSLAAGAAVTFIARHLLLVAAGAYDMVEPGNIYSFDLLTLESGRQAVLKAPRCPTCSSTLLTPKRTVRAIA